MAIRFERPVSHAAFIARRLGLWALILFAAAFLAYRFGPLRTPDFIAAVLFSVLVALAAVLLAAAGLVRLWRVGALGGVAAFKALLMASVPLGAAAIALYSYAVEPALYDISTDPLDPPPFLQRREEEQEWLPRGGNGAGAPAAAAARQTDLIGQRYDGAPDRVAPAVRKAASASRIVIVAAQGEEIAGQGLGVEDSGGGEFVPVPLPRPEPLLSAPPTLIGRPGDVLLQGEVRTFVFGFPFDVAIRLREEGDNTLVDVRAVSRYGGHDLGLGAGILRKFLDSLELEMLGLTGG